MHESDFLRIVQLMQAFDLPILAPNQMDYDVFMKHMQHDKKVLKGAIRFVIPQHIGKAVVTKDISQDSLRAILG